jgi:hypothetical protein
MRLASSDSFLYRVGGRTLRRPGSGLLLLLLLLLQVHVILNMLNLVTREVTEHHLMSAPAPMDDKFSHVYTLVLYQNHM